MRSNAPSRGLPCNAVRDPMTAVPSHLATTGIVRSRNAITCSPAPILGASSWDVDRALTVLLTRPVVSVDALASLTDVAASADPEWVGGEGVEGDVA